MSEKIIIEFQHFGGCPNGPLLLNNLKNALIDCNEITELHEVLIESPESAIEHKFRGSPTVLINGKDIEDMPEPEHPRLACRFYKDGLPDVEYIRRKICAGTLEMVNCKR